MVEPLRTPYAMAGGVDEGLGLLRHLGTLVGPKKLMREAESWERLDAPWAQRRAESYRHLALHITSLKDERFVEARGW